MKIVWCYLYLESTINFINSLSNYTLDTYIYFNKTKDYSVFNNIDVEYIYENIINKIENNINSVNSIKEIDNIELSDIYLLPTKVKLNESSQLYSEMIDEVIIICNEFEVCSKVIK